MPNRIIREAILTSDKVNQLGAKSELFYRRLMSVVDDFGRYDARVSILRVRCYPLKVDSIREADISRSLEECQCAGLIALYEVNDKPYLQMTNFAQQTRAKSSKWPNPPTDDSTCVAHASTCKHVQADDSTRKHVQADDSTCQHVQADDDTCQHVHTIYGDGYEDDKKEREEKTREEKPSERKKEEPKDFIEQQVEKIYQAYPKKCDELAAKVEIKKAIWRIVQKNIWEPPLTAKWLLVRVDLYAKSKAGKSPRFCKKPKNWFADGNYNDDPAVWDIDYNEQPEGKNGKNYSRSRKIKSRKGKTPEELGGFFAPADVKR